MFKQYVICSYDMMSDHYKEGRRHSKGQLSRTFCIQPTAANNKNKLQRAFQVKWHTERDHTVVKISITDPCLHVVNLHLYAPIRTKFSHELISSLGYMYFRIFLDQVFSVLGWQIAHNASQTELCCPLTTSCRGRSRSSRSVR